MMRFRATIRNEATGECPWFVYVETPQGLTYAARFSTERDARSVANAMNNRWEAEGRLYTYDPVTA
jgi:hypothetical protein